MYGVGRQLALEFLTVEEEQLVFRPLLQMREVNRAANGITHVVVPEQRPRQVSGVVEEGVRIQAVVAVLPVAAAMEMVGTALGNHVDLPARTAAVLCLIAVGQDLEFRDGVEANCYVQSTIIAGIDVPNTIDGQLILGRARSVHREVVCAVGTRDGVITAGCKLNAWNQLGQIQGTATVHFDV